MSPVAGNDASAKTNAMSAAQRRNHCVISDLFAYRLAHGVIPRPGWSGAEDTVSATSAISAGCTNPAHMRPGN